MTMDNRPWELKTLTPPPESENFIKSLHELEKLIALSLAIPLQRGHKMETRVDSRNVIIELLDIALEQQALLNELLQLYSTPNQEAKQKMIETSDRILQKSTGLSKILGSREWSTERGEVVLKLREICKEFGDNEWEDNLHLADILEKHLLKHLVIAKEATE